MISQVINQFQVKTSNINCFQFLKDQDLKLFYVRCVVVIWRHQNVEWILIMIGVSNNTFSQTYVANFDFNI